MPQPLTVDSLSAILDSHAHQMRAELQHEMESIREHIAHQFRTARIPTQTVSGNSGSVHITNHAGHVQPPVPAARPSAAASGYSGATGVQGAASAAAARSFAVSPPAPPQMLTASFPIRLLLLRHGESDSNTTPHLIAGQSNHVPLTNKGRQQANALAAVLKQCNYRPTIVLSSDAVRCRETLELLQLPPPRSSYSSVQLREQSQGQWEGKPRADVYTAEVRAAMKEHTVRFSGPGGESIADAAYRSYAYIMQVITREAAAIATVNEAGLDVLLVCHGQVIRGLVWLLCGLRDQYVWQLGCDNCSMTELHIDTNGVRLLRLNDAAHLRPPPPPPTEPAASAGNDRPVAATGPALSSAKRPR